MLTFAALPDATRNNPIVVITLMTIKKPKVSFNNSIWITYFHQSFSFNFLFASLLILLYSSMNTKEKVNSKDSIHRLLYNNWI